MLREFEAATDQGEGKEVEEEEEEEEVGVSSFYCFRTEAMHIALFVSRLRIHRITGGGGGGGPPEAAV